MRVQQKLSKVKWLSSHCSSLLLQGGGRGAISPSTILSPPQCICLTFPHCVFLNASSNGLHNDALLFQDGVEVPSPGNNVINPSMEIIPATTLPSALFGTKYGPLSFIKRSNTEFCLNVPIIANKFNFEEGVSKIVSTWQGKCQSWVTYFLFSCIIFVSPVFVLHWYLSELQRRGSTKPESSQEKTNWTNHKTPGSPNLGQMRQKIFG